MITTVGERAPVPAEAGFRPETYTSADEVYRAVLPRALELSVLTPGASPARDEFYDAGVVPVHLNWVNDTLGEYHTLRSDQTVQPTGAYKDRAMTGAVQEARRFKPDATQALTASAGNAGNALARVGLALGLKVQVNAARSASPVKLDLIRGRGAVVNDSFDNIEAAQAAVDALAEDPNVLALHPFDRFGNIIGNATVGFETIRDLLSLQRQGFIDLKKTPVRVLVPVGGGGLLGGVATAVRWAKDEGLLGEQNVEVIGGQMQGCDALYRTEQYLRLGLPIPEDLFAQGYGFDPRCDGAAVRRAGWLTSLLAGDRRYVQGFALVTPEEVGTVMRDVYAKEGVRLEPAGALGEAVRRQFARRHPVDRAKQGQPSAVLVDIRSGANVSGELFDEFVNLPPFRDDEADRSHWRGFYRDLGSLITRPKFGEKGYPKIYQAKEFDPRNGSVTPRGAALSGYVPRG